jgi:hypothetical protein
MAQHDVQPEVATAAKASMAAVFPGSKAQEALKFCRLQATPPPFPLHGDALLDSIHISVQSHAKMSCTNMQSRFAIVFLTM